MSNIKNLLEQVNELQNTNQNLNAHVNHLSKLVHDYANLVQRLYCITMDESAEPLEIFKQLDSFIAKRQKEVSHVNS